MSSSYIVRAGSLLVTYGPQFNKRISFPPLTYPAPPPTAWLFSRPLTFLFSRHGAFVGKLINEFQCVRCCRCDWCLHIVTVQLTSRVSQEKWNENLDQLFSAAPATQKYAKEKTSARVEYI